MTIYFKLTVGFERVSGGEFRKLDGVDDTVDVGLV